MFHEKRGCVLGCDAGTFLKRCRPLNDGFAGNEPVALWRLGAILFATRDCQFVAVRKAFKDGYEFSGNWALPGGMVRAAGTVNDFPAHAMASVAERASAEASLAPGQLAVQPNLGPVVTSYTARSARRFTIVVCFQQALASDFAPSSSDQSIQIACLMPFTSALSEFAPANRLILGHLLWPHLSAREREVASAPVNFALTECLGYASAAGVAPPVGPWASASAIEAWTYSWPGEP